MENSELKHYGIKGMKWGVRRFQNADGTYTEAGKKRAAAAEKKTPMSDEELAARVRRLTMEKQYSKLSKESKPPSKTEEVKKAVDSASELVSRAKKMDQESRSAARKKQRLDLTKMSDKELREQINRELLERQYNDLFAKENVSRGREYVSKALDASGTVLTVGSSALSIALMLKKLKAAG